VQAIIRTSADPINQSGIVMSLADARELFYMDEEAHELVVRATKSGVSEVLAASLAQAPELAELEVMSWGELVPDLALLVKMSDWVGYIVVLLVLVASIAGIANTLMMSTFERSHELGMLLALGSGPGRLVRLVMVEALLIGLLGVLAGTLAGGLSVAISASQGIDFASWGGAEARDMAYQGLNLPLLVYPRLELLDSIIGLVAIILTSLLAALYPAWVTSRLEPVEAMRA
jgi:putative ABC transport system permease protein